MAEEAYSAASLLCDNEYFDHPELKSRAVDTTDENAETQGRVTAVYVPAHLHHILFEVDFVINISDVFLVVVGRKEL